VTDTWMAMDAVSSTVSPRLGTPLALAPTNGCVTQGGPHAIPRREVGDEMEKGT
jgi:hypothetical protein